jgi:putative hydrolase of HD superfamily
MAILHDLGEASAGDFTPAHGVSKAEKYRLERAGLTALLSGLPGAEQWLELWEAYEAGESLEARLVRQLDRLELALQAGVYELEGLAALGEFFESAGQVVREPLLKAELETLLTLRPGFIARDDS